MFVADFLTGIKVFHDNKSILFYLVEGHKFSSLGTCA